MSSEKSLYDMMVIHQILLEHVKNNFDYEFRKRIPSLVKEIKYLISNLEYNNLGDMTKRELYKFSKSVEKVGNRFFSSYIKELNKALKEFMSSNRDLSNAMIANDLDISDSVIEDPKEIERLIRDYALVGSERRYPLAWMFGNDDSKLFESIMNRPTPYSGHSSLFELDKFKVGVVAAITAEVNKAWVNGQSKGELSNSIFGTSENNLKDGILLKIERQNSAILRTIQQSIAIETEVAIQSLIWKKYKWVSILDSKTSEICRYLSGRIFEYGKGPLPPKHNHCRSRIVPLNSSVPTNPESFLAWIKRQSREDQISLVGIKKADLIRDGKAKDIDFLKIDSAIRLKPEELRNKLALLTR